MTFINLATNTHICLRVNLAIRDGGRSAIDTRAKSNRRCKSLDGAQVRPVQWRWMAAVIAIN